MDRFNAMQAFARVVEAGSFTKAAQTLHMSKTTVTQLVQQLEARLRVKLLNRTTRQVKVTACRSTPRCLVRLAWSWASPKSSRGPIARRPMGRPRGSSSLRCASGPMGTPTRTHNSAARPCRFGRISTTGTGRTTESILCRLSRVSRCLQRTS